MNELKSALESLNLRAIYWVDDENAARQDISVGKLVSDLVERVATGGEGILGALIGKVSPASRPGLVALRKSLVRDAAVDPGERPDRRQQIRAAFEEVTEAAEDPKAMLTGLVEALDGVLSRTEKAALSALFGPLAGELGYVWRPLSFTDWERDQEVILSAHSPAAPALVLLDQQNSRDQSSLDGTQILRNICTEQTHGRGFKFLIVTNTCSPEGEFNHSVGLARDLHLDDLGIRSPLFTLSKSRISRALADDSAQDALAAQFVPMLRRLSLALLNQSLAELAKQVLSEASDRAFARLTSMSLHEYLYAVTQSSQLEGVSELDTLLRLLAIEQRSALLTEVVRNTALRRAIERVREQPLDIRKQEIDADNSLAELRSREVYWPSKSVNQLYQPVSVGDIFEYKAPQSTDYYVLLGNDCDLMLRGDGIRVASYALLAQLKEHKGELDAPLEHPLPERPSMKRVALNNFLAVRMEILDLCWMNVSGVCVFDPRADASTLHLLASQKARASAIAEKLKKKRDLAALVASSPFAASPSRTIPGRVDFKLKRVNRLSATYAHGILARFCAVLARPSFDHDYATLRESGATLH